VMAARSSRQIHILVIARHSNQSARRSGHAAGALRIVKAWSA
jgi:hypothetical protein